jgi:hypothetical protein
VKHTRCMMSRSNGHTVGQAVGEQVGGGELACAPPADMRARPSARGRGAGASLVEEFVGRLIGEGADITDRQAVAADGKADVPAVGTRRVRLVRGEGRGVSD